MTTTTNVDSDMNASDGNQNESGLNVLLLRICFCCINNAKEGRWRKKSVPMMNVGDR